MLHACLYAHMEWCSFKTRPGPASEFIARDRICRMVRPPFGNRTLNRHLHRATPPDDVTEVRLGLLVSEQIDIAAIKVQPWIRYF